VIEHVRVRAPGRVCLFGEHQDYLGLPVIAAAIDRYICIEGDRVGEDPLAAIHLPDLGQALRIAYGDSGGLTYASARDYLRSCLVVAARRGATLGGQWDVTVRGTIPINAGASSSSALVIAWLAFVFQAAGCAIGPSQLGEAGYQAEVAEFGEAGGMMDHFASAWGGVITVDSVPAFTAARLAPTLRGLVLANSGVKKTTVEDLRRVKAGALDSIRQVREALPSFDMRTTPTGEVVPCADSLSPALRRILLGNLANRDLTQAALRAFQESTTVETAVGPLLLQHHRHLSRDVGVSIPVIDEMVDAAMAAGALGAKINGSGFGGTIVALAPGNQGRVVEDLRARGFEAWAVEVAGGAGSW
jgi:galactokinase